MEAGRASTSPIQGEICKSHWNAAANQIQMGKEKWSDISPEEEDLIQRLHHLVGDRWELIAGRLQHRNADEVEKHWRRMQEKSDYEKSKLCKPIFHRLSPSFKFTTARALEAPKICSLEVQISGSTST